MIVYEATKGEFVDSVFSGSITDEIYDVYKEKIGKSAKSQIRSWENSMEFMYKILIDDEIPDDSGIAIEFTIPTTSKRIDFIISGQDDNKTDNVVITDVDLDIVDYSIEFQQNSMTINLLSCKITANERIDNVFVNVNGYGCQDLRYSQSANTDGYYVITITPTSSILSCAFGDDTKITADIYVEYASRSYKVVSKDIDVRSCWINF